MAPSIYSLLFSHFDQTQNIVLVLPTHAVLTISKSWKTTLNCCHNLVTNMIDKEYCGSLLWLLQWSPVQFCVFAYFLLYFLSIVPMSSYSPNPQHLDRCTVLCLNIHQNQFKIIFCINIEKAYVNSCHLYWCTQIFFSPHWGRSKPLFLSRMSWFGSKYCHNGFCTTMQG